MSFIYVLQLEHEKYYVGKSKNPKFRFRQHVEGKGTKWTKIHPPISLLGCTPGDGFDEISCTLRLMKKHGIENVRGASWSRVKLSEMEMEEITRQITGAIDKCYRCGEYGHFISRCKAEISDDWIEINREDVPEVQEEESEAEEGGLLEGFTEFMEDFIGAMLELK